MSAQEVYCRELEGRGTGMALGVLEGTGTEREERTGEMRREEQQEQSRGEAITE